MNLREKAYCFALDENAIAHYCSACAKSDREEKLSRCSSCKLILYCSNDCQKADWCLHKAECKYIKKSGEVGDESLRLVLRLNSKSRVEYEQSAPDMPGTSRTFEDLMCHTVLIETDYYKKWETQFRKFMAGSNITDQRLKELYGKMSVNGFGLSNQNAGKIGLALHIRLSAINHSCKPKTRIAYVGNEAVMVPTEKLAKGTELTIDEAQHSYINEMLPRKERRKLLKGKYNFDCYCDGCNDEQRNQSMSGFACENCGSCVELGGQCKNCKMPMTCEHIELCELNNKMVDAAQKSLKTANNSSVGTQMIICEKILDLMEGVYYKFNVNFFTVLRCAMGCALKLQRLPDATKFGERLIVFHEFYQSPNDLSLLHMKFNVGKLYIAQKNTTKAKTYLLPVQEMFKEIYGENSVIVKDIRDLLSKNE